MQIGNVQPKYLHNANYTGFMFVKIKDDCDMLE